MGDAGSIAGKIVCTAQTLHQWVGRAERDGGRKPGLTTDTAAKLKTLERENRELRQANEILRKASAYLAQADTRDFATNLSAIRADRATRLFDHGEALETPIAAIQPGDLVLVRAGEKSPLTAS